MNDPAAKAVFLSYASQDAGAAKRICEALRARGVEVWFDVEGGLETGDEWDQKIRRQIKECVLFIAVISQNTQARHEGYFRIEWDLAAERARGIASGIAFILPVVIDDTREPDALVPDRFRAVQWTRIPGGELSPDVLARFVKLWSHRTGAVKHAENPDRNPGFSAGRDAASAPAAQPTAKAAPGWWKVVVPVAGLIVGLVYAFRPSGGREPREKPETSVATANAASPKAAFPRDPELRRAMDLTLQINSIREDLLLAEEIAKRAVDRAPTDPETVTVMAHVQAMFVMRNFDFTTERTSTARRFCERAVQLASDQPVALAALATFLYSRGNDLPRAEEIARSVVQREPDNARYARLLATVVARLRPTEGVTLSEDGARRFPGDALSRYDLAIRYRDASRYEESERELDAAIALAPVANALDWKARYGLLHEDLPAMKAWIERVPSRLRGEERSVLTSVVYAYLSGDTAFGLAALGKFPEAWFYDASNYTGPKSLLTALLHDRRGNAELARGQYEAALTELRRYRDSHPSDASTLGTEALILVGLNRLDDARRSHRAALQIALRPFRATAFTLWISSNVRRAFLVGDRPALLALLKEVAGDKESRGTVRSRMKLDPLLASYRADPEILAILAEPAGSDTKTTATPPPTGPAKELSESAQLAARALTLFTKTGFTRDDLGTAEELAKRATDRDPDNAAAWGVRAGIQAAWLFRNWDRSENRRKDTQMLANKALALDSNEPEALLALGHLLRAQGARAQAEEHLRRAMTSHPEHVRLARALGFSLSLSGQNEAARTVLQSIATRAPRDPLIRYELAMTFAEFGPGGADPDNLARALEQLDAAVAIQPFASALILKALLLGGWRGDLTAMRATLDQLDQLSLPERSEDRSVFASMWAALVEHTPARVETTAALTARTYFEDEVMPLRPKAWSLALAHRLAGKTNLARREWQAAESVLRQRVKEYPSNTIYQVELAITLAWLEETEEATRLIGAVEPMWREELNAGRARLLARYYAARGDVPNTVVYLPSVVDRTLFTSRAALARDPWWDKVRNAPEFAALLEPAKK